MACWGELPFTATGSAPAKRSCSTLITSPSKRYPTASPKASFARVPMPPVATPKATISECRKNSWYTKALVMGFSIGFHLHFVRHPAHSVNEPIVSLDKCLLLGVNRQVGVAVEVLTEVVDIVGRTFQQRSGPVILRAKAERHLFLHFFPAREAA